MPALILGIVAGVVALYGLGGWAMSWGQATGLLATGLIAAAFLAATAIGSQLANASIGVITTLALFRWLLIVPMLGSAVLVIGAGRMSERDGPEVIGSIGVALVLLVPELLWLRRKWQSGKPNTDSDA